MRFAKIVVFALMLAAPVTASAQAPSSPLPTHLPLRQEVCYSRVYDAAHLAKHPNQLVTSLHLYRAITPDQNTETEPLTPQQALEQDGESGQVSVHAYVRFKNRKGVFWNALGCGTAHDGSTRCSIECDGGSFGLKPQQKSLILSNNGFVLIGGCGASDDEQENSVFFDPGADDKTFRLEPLPPSQCTAIRDALIPAYAKLGKPLRVRFATDKPVCYTRSYDDAHLAKNPKQLVKRIAMLKAGPKKGPDEDSGYDLRFQIELKNGKKFTQNAKCYAEDYAYGCPAKAEADTQRDFYVTRAGEDALSIRDRRGRLGEFFGTALGADDRLFRLNAAAASACEF
jgi:hypothetical protein